MNFSDLDSAIAWAKTKVPEDRAESAKKAFLTASEKHGVITEIGAGMTVSLGIEADEAYPGSQAIPPFPYIWLRATWANPDPKQEWHLPIQLKMERWPTAEEAHQHGAW